MERYLCDTCLYANNCQFIAKHKEGAIGCSAYINTFGVSIDRLREICEAEQEGRLLISPCKDFLNVMFEVDTFFILDDGDVIEATNSDEKWFNYDKHTGDITISFIDGDDEIFYIKMSEIGKTVFLTRAEAEEALKEAQHE